MQNLRHTTHLAQRRGFKSNRKTDKTGEEGVIAKGIGSLRTTMAVLGARTVGEFLYKRHKNGKSTRSRRAESSGEYPFYLDRSLVAEEFDRIVAAQAAHQPTVSAEAFETLKKVLLHQRPLKKPVVGRCTLMPDEERAMRVERAAQEFRIAQDLINLRITRTGEPDRQLSDDQRGMLFDMLRTGRKSGNNIVPHLTFNQLKKALKLETGEGINLDDGKRKKLEGDLGGALMCSPDRFGQRWWTMSEEDRDDVMELLLHEPEHDLVVAQLKARWGLSDDAAEAVSEAPVDSGKLGMHVHLCAAVMKRLVPLMVDEGLDYAAACARLGLHHSDFRPGELLKYLPYYAEVLPSTTGGGGAGGAHARLEDRFGRFPNPTVHIALNQLRRVVNGIIRKHGPLHQVVLEVARDLKNSKQRKDEISSRQRDNQKRNDRAREMMKAMGVQDSFDNRTRYRLWEQLSDNPLECRCVFTGQVISAADLFSSSVEVEHLLPFSRTLDNGISNKVLCFTRANRAKGNRTPFEAFGHSPAGYDWDAICRRAEAMPPAVKWRFQPEAMERYEAEEGGFLDRQLTDTAYLSKVAKAYMGHVCDPNNVYATPGRLTGEMRHQWGLNSLLSGNEKKNRNDHRHHTLDAVVIACTDRGVLNAFAKASGRGEDISRRRIDPPWSGLRSDLGDALNGVVVSHRRDHGLGGALHEETAYGIVEGPDGNGMTTVVTRKLFETMEPKDLKKIADPSLRERLEAELAEAAHADKKTWQAARMAAAKRYRLRRVRIHMKMKNLVVIRDSEGRPYKAYKPGSNHCTHVVLLPDGKWKGVPVTRFDANQGTEPEFNGELLYTLHNNDVVELGDGSGLWRIQKMSRGEFYLVRLVEANVDARHHSKDEPFKYYQKAVGSLGKIGLRPVRIDELGQVWRDPLPEPLRR